MAQTAIAAAGALNVSFPLFCPETCLSTHDNKPDVRASENRDDPWKFYCGARRYGYKERMIIACKFEAVHTAKAGLLLGVDAVEELLDAYQTLDPSLA